MRRHPKRTLVDPNNPRAWGTDDRSGFVGNHEDMVWQWDWAGPSIIKKNVLIYPDQLDKPQRQLGSLVLPPDPVPVLNARVEPYPIDERWSTMAEGSNQHGAIPIYLEQSSQPTDDAQVAIDLELSTIDAD